MKAYLCILFTLALATCAIASTTESQSFTISGGGNVNYTCHVTLDSPSQHDALQAISTLGINPQPQFRLQQFMGTDVAQYKSATLRVKYMSSDLNDSSQINVSASVLGTAFDQLQVRCNSNGRTGANGLLSYAGAKFWLIMNQAAEVTVSTDR